VTTESAGEAKRPYDLGKRLEQMDHSRAAILRAAREQLEAKGYRHWTMSSLAAQSGVTRQTVHNLFGTKRAILEALFDVIALDGGLNNMRDVMTQSSPDAMLREFVEVFCLFWAGNRLLIRRIHGIGAIDPEFGSVIDDRNSRRFRAAMRIVTAFGLREKAKQRAAALNALTSFEFFDALADNLQDDIRTQDTVLELARSLVAKPS
jgi:AcrR family transcriptional regulator